MQTRLISPNLSFWCVNKGVFKIQSAPALGIIAILVVFFKMSPNILFLF